MLMLVGYKCLAGCQLVIGFMLLLHKTILFSNIYIGLLLKYMEKYAQLIQLIRWDNLFKCQYMTVAINTMSYLNDYIIGC